MHSLSFPRSVRLRWREKIKEWELGTVSRNNVDVTVGALRGVWLCRHPGAHQLTWDSRLETGDINLDKGVFDCSLLVVLLILEY